MGRVLINACAAKEGGAYTIAQNYIRSVEGDGNLYVVISPFKPSGDNILWIKVFTSGILTFMFSIFIIYIYYIRYGCDKIISFNNVNCILPAKNKVTYFHNELILSERSAKYNLLRFVISKFNSIDGTFVFQTIGVKNKFEALFGPVFHAKVCWPGVDSELFNKIKSTNNAYRNSLKKVMYPVTDLSLKHKNVSLFLDIVNCSPTVTFYITSFEPEDWAYAHLDNIKFVGKLDKENYIELLDSVDATLVTSLKETVGLPIFESLLFGKPAFVYNATYIHDIIDYFGKIDNMYVFEDHIDFSRKISEVKSVKPQSNLKIFKSDWSF